MSACAGVHCSSLQAPSNEYVLGLSHFTNNMLHFHLCMSSGFVGKNLCQLLRYLAALLRDARLDRSAGKSAAVVSVFFKHS